MPFLEREDVTLYYELDRRGDRPVLVLSNSLGTNLDLWWQQAGPFAEHFSVLRYDTRGQGQSSTPSGPYSVAAMGGDVLALLDALKLDRVHFCGISMGGLIGQCLGIHAPERLRGLVLSNTAARIGETANWDQRIAAVEKDGIWPLLPTILGGWLTERFRQERPDVVMKLQAMLGTNQPAGYTACSAAVRDADFRETVRTIAVPTLVVWSAQDRSTTRQDARFLLEHINGAQELSLEAAHISNVEAAEAFTAGVVRFLQTL